MLLKDKKLIKAYKRIMTIDYKLGKIYKIVDNTNGNIYIGSTCQPTLAHRLAKHRSNYKYYCASGNKHIITTSFNIIKNANYYIELIENYSCNSKDELLKRERYYIQTLNCVNKMIPGRTKEEYKKECKDKIKKYQDDYWKKNTDYKHTRLNCLCGSTYLRRSYYLHVKTGLHKQFIFDNHNQIMIDIDLLLTKTNAFIKKSESFISKYIV